MKKLIVSVLLICLATWAFSESATIQQADKLYDQGKHAEAKSFLENALNNTTDKTEKFEILWRLARATMEYGNDKEDEGYGKDQLIAIYQEGVAYAEQAIAVDPKQPRGYFWKSANLGRWGEVKGIMESLNMAKEMRELLITCIKLDAEFGLGWHVLGILYERVPGGIISFGDKNFSVSLARKAIDTHEAALKKGIDEEINYGYYVELARHLEKRNANESKRKKIQRKAKEEYKSASDLFEKNCYYEATINQKSMSDREEALELIRWVIREIENIPNQTFSHKDDLKDAKETLESLK
jgi:tetratricopeptide (TPR) repeat protein